MRGRRMRRRMEYALLGNESLFLSYLNNHRIKHYYTLRLLWYNKMFISVYDEAHRHFYLYVLDIKKLVVERLDLLAQSNGCVSHDKNVHKLMLDIMLKDEIEEIYYVDSGLSFSQFRLEIPQNIPHQTNLNDCGVFVIKFMLESEEMKNSTYS